MIAVIGLPSLRAAEPLPEPDGLVVAIASAARASGADVELIGKVGNDPAGDALLLGLARMGVGHVATLRDPARATPRRPAVSGEMDLVADDNAGDATTSATTTAPVLDDADVELALRYVSDIQVIVAVHPSEPILAVAVEAAAWSGAHLVVVRERVGDATSTLPRGALVIEADAGDGAPAVGAAIGRYAAAIDRGDAVSVAYDAFTAAARA